MADQRGKLAEIAFHAKLGSVLERVLRLEKLVAEIAEYVPGAEVTMAVEAAALCKSDLVSGMVGEFPELQGLMGSYYALAENAPRHVANAIRDHYKPLGPGDICPTEPVSVVLALAEKIDTLVGFFAVGEPPTGSKDPFALRRAALGAIRLIVENGLRCELNTIIRSAFLNYASQRLEGYGFDSRDSLRESVRKYFQESRTAFISRITPRRSEFMKALDDNSTSEWRFAEIQSDLMEFMSGVYVSRRAEAIEELEATKKEVIEEVQTQLLSFFADRLKVVLKERGVRHDLVDAVFALGGEDDLVRLLARVQALQDFLSTDDGANLLIAYRRAANILRIEEKKDGVSYDGAIDRDRLAEPEEIVLARALDEASDKVDPLIATEDFHGAMSVYSVLRPVVDAFFNQVTVNADNPDIRASRLRLLSRIRSTLNKIADFSRIG